MINILIRWVVYAILIIFVSWIVPGIEVDNFISAMFVCIIIALINTFIKPLLYTSYSLKIAFQKYSNIKLNKLYL